jgi:hypothetical protein
LCGAEGHKYSEDGHGDADPLGEPAAGVAGVFDLFVDFVRHRCSPLALQKGSQRQVGVNRF